MKRLFINLGLFIVLIFAVSSLISCQSKVAETNESKYPPLPEGIANTEIKMVDGTSFKMADKKGKVVLLNLWATWCGPCREEMPTLVELHDKYKDKGFEVIGLDTDESETVEMINDFSKDMKLNYPLGFSDAKLFTQFVKVSGLNGIPQSILVNRDGKMTGVFTGGGEKVLTKMRETVEKTVNE